MLVGRLPVLVELPMTPPDRHSYGEFRMGCAKKSGTTHTSPGTESGRAALYPATDADGYPALASTPAWRASSAVRLVCSQGTSSRSSRPKWP